MIEAHSVHFDTISQDQFRQFHHYRGLGDNVKNAPIFDDEEAVYASLAHQNKTV